MTMVVVITCVLLVVIQSAQANRVLRESHLETNPIPATQSDPTNSSHMIRKPRQQKTNNNVNQLNSPYSNYAEIPSRKLNNKGDVSQLNSLNRDYWNKEQMPVYNNPDHADKRPYISYQDMRELLIPRQHASSLHNIHELPIPRPNGPYLQDVHELPMQRPNTPFIQDIHQLPRPNEVHQLARPIPLLNADLHFDEDVHYNVYGPVHGNYGVRPASTDQHVLPRPIDPLVPPLDTYEEVSGTGYHTRPVNGPYFDGVFSKPGTDRMVLETKHQIGNDGSNSRPFPFGASFPIGAQNGIPGIRPPAFTNIEPSSGEHFIWNRPSSHNKPGIVIMAKNVFINPQINFRVYPKPGLLENGMDHRWTDEANGYWTSAANDKWGNSGGGQLGNALGGQWGNGIRFDHGRDHHVNPNSGQWGNTGGGQLDNALGGQWDNAMDGQWGNGIRFDHGRDHHVKPNNGQWGNTGGGQLDNAIGGQWGNAMGGQWGNGIRFDHGRDHHLKPNSGQWGNTGGGQLDNAIGGQWDNGIRFDHGRDHHVKPNSGQWGNTGGGQLGYTGGGQLGNPIGGQWDNGIRFDHGRDHHVKPNHINNGLIKGPFGMPKPSIFNKYFFAALDNGSKPKPNYPTDKVNNTIPPANQDKTDSNAVILQKPENISKTPTVFMEITGDKQQSVIGQNGNEIETQFHPLLSPMSTMMTSVETPN